MRVLAENYEQCPNIYIRPKSLHSKNVIDADRTVTKPNPTCYVCSPKPFVNVFVNTATMSIKEFEVEILKKGLNMIAPDVAIDGMGTIIISSESGETAVKI